MWGYRDARDEFAPTRESIATEQINSRWDIDKFQESTVSFLVKRIKKLTSDVHFSEQNFIIFHISVF